MNIRHAPSAVRGDHARTLGAVLAGGASRRMGRDKAMLEINGRPLITHVVCRVSQALPRVVVVGPTEALRAVLPGVEVLPDRVHGAGPLGGLATALAAADAEWLAVVACDMPFVSPPLLRAMLATAARHPDADAIVLRTPRGREPLHAVYACRCSPVVEARLHTSDHSLTLLLAWLKVYEMPAEEVAVLDPRGLATFNTNAPAEWELALRLARGESAAAAGYDPPTGYDG